MKKTLAVLTSSTLLAACGGGSSTPAEQAAAPLAVYAGSWQTPCQDKAIETMTITSKADGSLEIADKIEHFETANCSGTPFATQSPSATSTVSYGSTAEVQVQLNPAGATNTTRIDKITLSSPTYTNVFTGKDLIYSVELGKPAWCVTHPDKPRSCAADAGQEPASTQTGGLYLQGDKLYQLLPDAAVYKTNFVLTRK